MLFIANDEVLDRSLAGAEKIRVEKIEDTEEIGGKKFYQIAEIILYFGWPFVVGFAFAAIFSEVNIFWSIAIGALSFFWPYIKGQLGRRVARLKGIEDPRHAIRSSSFWFDGFLFWGSPILREIRQYAALSRSLDVIYNAFCRFGIKPARFQNEKWAEVSSFGCINYLIKAWSCFWLKMPIAQDVRTRLEIIVEEYRKKIRTLTLANPGQKIRILEVAGGQLQAVVMGLARAKEEANFHYEVVSIEPEAEFSKPRALELIRHFGLDEKCFVFITSKISTKSEKGEKHIANILMVHGIEPRGFDFVVCIGLGDYYFQSKRVAALLRLLDLGKTVIAANVVDNFVERIFLHILIQWPFMKYRHLRAWREIVEEVFRGRTIRIVQTPLGIFNIAVVE